MKIFLSLFHWIQSIPTWWKLRNARKVFLASCQLLESKKQIFDYEKMDQIASLCNALKEALQNKKASKALEYAAELKNLSKTVLRKSLLSKSFDFVLGITVALIIATLIRQTWFELYRIPTGSMRPTLKESDFLIVSKTNYGINFPLKTDHFYFNPDLIKRGDIIVFSGDQMDIRDVDTMYFYLFPGKKQFVKRLIGKEGDKLYFYGGLIYGIDKNGQPIPELHASKIANTFEHIPFIKFEDKTESVKKGMQNITTFLQMNQPIAKLTSQSLGGYSYEMLQNGSDYYDIWGFKNFAMVKIVPKEEVPIEDRINNNSFFLKMQHHPSLKKPTIRYDQNLRMRASLSYSYSYLPLSDLHLEKIQKALYTARFNVRDGKALRYGTALKALRFYPYFPKLALQDGTYEFDNGKAYKEIFQGQLTLLPSTHPIYSTQTVTTLFNLGIEFDTQWEKDGLFPSRYAYFRNGGLYLMGKEIFTQDDPLLQSFISHEKEKENKNRYHHAFIDHGPPLLADGSLDTELIQNYGVEIPKGSYLALGDNHAMSGDSREFGFVPEKNLKGKVSFVLFPFSSRWPFPMQPGSIFLQMPTIVIWGFFLTALLAYLVWQNKKKKKFFS